MKNPETSRLIFGKFVPSDLNRFAQLAADTDLMRFSLRGALTRDEAEELSERISSATRVGKPS